MKHNETLLNYFIMSLKGLSEIGSPIESLVGLTTAVGSLQETIGSEEVARFYKTLLKEQVNLLNARFDNLKLALSESEAVRTPTYKDEDFLWLSRHIAQVDRSLLNLTNEVNHLTSKVTSEKTEVFDFESALEDAQAVLDENEKFPFGEVVIGESPLYRNDVKIVIE